MGGGYDLSSRVPFRLMQGRLGTYDKAPFEPNGLDPQLKGIEHQATRFRQNGGNLQQERMIRSKRKSLDHAVWYSYQGAEVVLDKAELKKPVRALINPNKLKQDYDDKVISVGFEYNFQAGDTFEWLGTKSHWLIVLQDLTELAYFRGEIRRCTYEIKWEDENGEHSTFAAIRGPVETRIDYIQKHNISIDDPNHSLNILMPLNKDNKEYFTRYSKFYLVGDDTCWRVEATDWISTPGILEINAVEYYRNETEDDIEKGIVGGLIVDAINPNTAEIEETIEGDTFIKPKTIYSYEYNGSELKYWTVDKKYPVELIVDKNEPRKLQLKWTSSFSGQFELAYGDLIKTIVVESLF